MNCKKSVVLCPPTILVPLAMSGSYPCVIEKLIAAWYLVYITRATHQHTFCPGPWKSGQTRQSRSAIIADIAATFQLTFSHNISTSQPTSQPASQPTRSNIATHHRNRRLA